MSHDSLRNTARQYLRANHQGRFRVKKYRAYVINKLVHDLFLINATPASWKDMHQTHFRKLIHHWHQQKLKNSTIMGYMTIIRAFLATMACPLEGLDNSSLALKRDTPYVRRPKVLITQCHNLNNAVAHFIMSMQIHFGLTFSEAIRLVCNIHHRDNGLWITRDIASNALDRFILMRHHAQYTLLKQLKAHTLGNQNLLAMYGHDGIRYFWRTALKAKMLPTHRSYRHFYAIQLAKHLSETISQYKASWIIRDEMGIKSRNTLRRYLNESS